MFYFICSSDWLCCSVAYTSAFLFLINWSFSFFKRSFYHLSVSMSFLSSLMTYWSCFPSLVWRDSIAATSSLCSSSCIYSFSSLIILSCSDSFFDFSYCSCTWLSLCLNSLNSWSIARSCYSVKFIMVFSLPACIVFWSLSKTCSCSYSNCNFFSYSSWSSSLCWVWVISIFFICCVFSSFYSASES